MSPPPVPAHSKKQNRIGVKAIDVAWLAPERGQEADTETCLNRAPEICVEILSPPEVEH